MERGIAKWIFFIALSSFGGQGIAQSMTYDFTGTVYEATGTFSSVPVGTEVQGTFSLSLGYAVPGEGLGTVGSASSSWTLEAVSGTFTEFGLQPRTPQPLMFTSSFQGGQFSFSTAAPSLFFNRSIVEGMVNSAGGGTYSAESLVSASSQNVYTQSGFDITNKSGVPWSASGLPILAGGTGSGGILSDANSSLSYLQFKLTSFYPAVPAVPEPPTYLMMFAGIACVGFLAFSRRFATLLVR